MDFEANYQALREGNRLEAKRADAGLPRSLWETYSAFANTGGGTVLLGVEELPDGSLRPVGVPNARQVINDFWNTVNNPNKVSARIVTDADLRVVEVDGVEVIAIEVPRADRLVRPVYIGPNPLTGTYRRNGEGDYLCSGDEYRAMVRDASPESLDRAPCEHATVDLLCGDTVAAYRSALAALRPGHPWVGLPFEDFLLRLGAAVVAPGAGGVIPTRAGLFMFGEEYAITQEFPTYVLDYREMREDGGRRWEDRLVSFDGTWSGNLFDFWHKAASRLTADLKRPFGINGSLVRTDDTPLHRAVREALTNALVHGDYQGSGGVVIVRRPHEIEFSNPGLSRVPVQLALAGGITDARNATLARMFGLVGLGERAGSGLESMVQACGEAGVQPPRLAERFAPDRTVLTLGLRPCSESGPGAGACAGRFKADGRLWEPEPVVDQYSVPLSEQDQVMRLFATRYHVARRDVQEALGVNETKAKRLLIAMRDEGLIEAVGAGRGAAYRLAQ